MPSMDISSIFRFLHQKFIQSAYFKKKAMYKVYMYLTDAGRGGSPWQPGANGKVVLKKTRWQHRTQ
jgi:hypothetical protein